MLAMTDDPAAVKTIALADLEDYTPLVDAAAEIGCDPSLLRQYKGAGRLETVQLGTRSNSPLYIHNDEVERVKGVIQGRRKAREARRGQPKAPRKRRPKQKQPQASS